MGVVKGLELPEDTWEKIDRLAKSMGLNRSELMRKILGAYRTQLYYNPLFFDAFEKKVAYYEGELEGKKLRKSSFMIDIEDDRALRLIAARLRKPLYVVLYAMVRESLPRIEAEKTVG